MPPHWPPLFHEGGHPFLQILQRKKLFLIDTLGLRQGLREGEIPAGADGFLGEAGYGGAAGGDAGDEGGHGRVQAAHGDSSGDEAQPFRFLAVEGAAGEQQVEATAGAAVS